MITICDNRLCTGCGACFQACPKQCITMKANSEGFLYPDIDQKHCIDCKKCQTACAALNPYKKDDFISSTFAVQSKDENLLSKSSSGAAAGEIARYVFNKGGVIYGCAFDKDMVAKHIRIDSFDSINLLCGSKYVQSTTDICYIQVKEDLHKGLNVAFFGTPCQIDGLKSFLVGSNCKKFMFNLLTIEIICHGVPSPKLFSSYIRWKEQFLNEKVTQYSFRGKSKYGWNTAYILTTRTRTITSLSTLDPYYNDFMQAKNYRGSCYYCRYANPQRIADLTIGDYWGILQAHSEWKNEMKKGVSVLIVNSNHGMTVWNTIKDQFIWNESTFEKAAARNGNLIHPVAIPTDRKHYYDRLTDGDKFDAYAVQFFHSKEYLSANIKAHIPQCFKKMIKKILSKE